MPFYQSPFTFQARQPVPASYQSPYGTQNPYIASARNPFTYNYRSPFTYQAPARQPATYQSPYI